MLADRKTLTDYLIEERRRYPQATGDFNALVLDVAIACKIIARRLAHGALQQVLGATSMQNAQGETQQKLDVVANDIFLSANEGGGHLAGLASEEMDAPAAIPERYPKGRYLLLFDPLDGSSNLDVNVSVGSIFSVLRALRPGEAAAPDDFLQPGTQQVCAGYAIYGPSTMFVLTIGRGTHAFTLDPDLGEFILTHPDIKVPAAAGEFAINVSNHRFWEPAVRRYVDECLAGKSGPRGRDFNMRWIASLVAEAHRILMRGGVFLYPRDSKDPTKAGRLRLLYEANPVAFLMEQAGGRASTGRERISDIVPSELHQRIPFIFGASEEVDLIERYHLDPAVSEYDAPLFGARGLFRAAT
ncbi:MAG: class 1 fructose-bisphosphatase [Pseudolabrys sp.]|nr:class 1 fructose-bisphosphatase [Pseudolabrys sp.]